MFRIFCLLVLVFLFSIGCTDASKHYKKNKIEILSLSREGLSDVMVRIRVEGPLDSVKEMGIALNAVGGFDFFEHCIALDKRKECDTVLRNLSIGGAVQLRPYLRFSDTTIYGTGDKMPMESRNLLSESTYNLGDGAFHIQKAMVRKDGSITLAVQSYKYGFDGPSGYCLEVIVLDTLLNFSHRATGDVYAGLGVCDAMMLPDGVITVTQVTEGTKEVPNGMHLEIQKFDLCCRKQWSKRITHKNYPATQFLRLQQEDCHFIINSSAFGKQGASNLLFEQRFNYQGHLIAESQTPTSSQAATAPVLKSVSANNHQFTTISNVGTDSISKVLVGTYRVNRVVSDSTYVFSPSYNPVTLVRGGPSRLMMLSNAGDGFQRGYAQLARINEPTGVIDSLINYPDTTGPLTGLMKEVAMDVDKQGNFYLSGDITDNDSKRPILTKFSANGTVQWQFSAPAAKGSSITGYAALKMPDNSVVMIAEESRRGTTESWLKVYRIWDGNNPRSISEHGNH